MTNITLSELQKIIAEWVKKNNFGWSNYAAYCHLVEEVGELGESITVASGERKAGSGAQALADHTNVSEELGDVLFSLIDISNRYNIDLNKCFKNTIVRYNQKVTMLASMKGNK